MLVRTGDELSVWYTLRNAGTAAVPEDAVVGVQIDLAADEAGAGARSGSGRVEPDAAGLAPGESMTRAFSVAQPEEGAGLRFLLVQVRVPDLAPDADPDNDVAAVRLDAPLRPRPSNASRTRPSSGSSSEPAPMSGGADLAFESLHLTGRRAEQIDYRYVLRNVGTEPVPGDLRLTLTNYLSPDREVGPEAKRAHALWLRGVDGLAPGKRFEGTFWATRPEGEFRFLVLSLKVSVRGADADLSNNSIAVPLDAPLEPMPTPPPIEPAPVEPAADDPAAVERSKAPPGAARTDSPDPTLANRPAAPRPAARPGVSFWLVALCPAIGFVVIALSVVTLLRAMRSA